MADGGGELAVGLSSVRVSDVRVGQLGEVPPGTYVCITVRDTGTGMSPEVLVRLFEPFFTTKGHAGTGLGLSVVHGIVREHDGVIPVAGDLGQGTTFRIYLPQASTVADPVSPPAGAPARGRGERVMIVDDEESILLVLQRILDRLGYECTCFTDAAAALQAFRTSPRAFEAVLTDGAMPSTTGVQLARELRAIRGDIRVAVVSGSHESWVGRCEPCWTARRPAVVLRPRA